MIFVSHGGGVMFKLFRFHCECNELVINEVVFVDFFGVAVSTSYFMYLVISIDFYWLVTDSTEHSSSLLV